MSRCCRMHPRNLIGSRERLMELKLLLLDVMGRYEHQCPEERQRKAEEFKKFGVSLQ